MTTKQAQPVATHKPTVLVIEDNADQWFIIDWAFRQQFDQVEPIWIADPAKAILFLEACLLDNEALPKLILLDAYLPHFEQSQKTLALLKAHPLYQDIPVLMLTSSRHAQDVQDCYESGCSSYLVKPTSPSQWQTLLAELRHYWWEIAELPSPH